MSASVPAPSEYEVVLAATTGGITDKKSVYEECLPSPTLSESEMVLAPSFWLSPMLLLVAPKTKSA
jgi:hypothetical protein